ncbi:MAG: hypothetical protein P0S95_05820 [Rhabdochlamydiaceae bacterium]|nr:hypothetical protein [Candidatus Amphrikana amoebophyrae]
MKLKLFIVIILFSLHPFIESLDQKECNQLYLQSTEIQTNIRQPNTFQQIHEAISSTQQAIFIYNTIINEIKGKQKKERGENWCKEITKKCEESKSISFANLHYLEALQEYRKCYLYFELACKHEEGIQYDLTYLNYSRLKARDSCFIAPLLGQLHKLYNRSPYGL